MDKSVVAWSMFLIMTLGLISLTPDLFISGTDYSPRDVNIPDDFSAWSLIPGYDTITNNLVTGQFVDYDFTENHSVRIRLSFNRNGDDRVVAYVSRSESTFWGYDSVPFEPEVSKDMVEAVFNNDENSSIIEITHVKGRATLIFEDQNVTRNNIGTAWDDRELKCTVGLVGRWEEDDDLGAREIVIALLTFNLDSVFRDINPVLGYFMSVTIMVPLMFVFFTVIMWGLHGE